MADTELLAPVDAFLGTRTPRAWCEAAVEDLSTLLNDHANCEKKAASTALALMFRYDTDGALADTMSRIAREELRHFEQVAALMRRLAIPHRPVSASRYAQGLRAYSGAPSRTGCSTFWCAAPLSKRAPANAFMRFNLTCRSPSLRSTDASSRPRPGTSKPTCAWRKIGLARTQ